MARPSRAKPRPKSPPSGGFTLEDLPAPLADGAKLVALGDPPDRRLRMNRYEAEFAAHLGRLRAEGRVLWYAFARITLHLADRTGLTIDFPVVDADRQILLYDVKAGRNFKRPDGTAYRGPIVEEDAMVKMKVAARYFPFRVRIAWPAATPRPPAPWTWEEREL